MVINTIEKNQVGQGLSVLGCGFQWVVMELYDF